jgi:hypothetical protein
MRSAPCLPDFSVVVWLRGTDKGAVAYVVEILPISDFSGKAQCTASGGEVNWLSELPIECAPAVDLSQSDLADGEQPPEQHGGRLR